jgi:hypothetical protein
VELGLYFERSRGSETAGSGFRSAIERIKRECPITAYSPEASAKRQETLRCTRGRRRTAQRPRDSLACLENHRLGLWNYRLMMVGRGTISMGSLDHHS